MSHLLLRATSFQALSPRLMASPALQKAVDDLNRATRLTKVEAVIRRAARRTSGADGSTLVFRDGEECFYADEDAISPLWKGQRFPITECVSGWAMLRDQSVIVPDIRADDRVPIDAYKPKFVASMAMVPITNDEPIGAIGVYWAKRYRCPDAVVDDLRRLAAATGQAIERLGLDGAPFLPSRVSESPHQAID
jgi:GAF domain-containing protein